MNNFMSDRTREEKEVSIPKGPQTIVTDVSEPAELENLKVDYKNFGGDFDFGEGEPESATDSNFTTKPTNSGLTTSEKEEVKEPEPEIKVPVPVPEKQLVPEVQEAKPEVFPENNMETFPGNNVKPFPGNNVEPFPGNNLDSFPGINIKPFPGNNFEPFPGNNVEKSLPDDYKPDKLPDDYKPEELEIKPEELIDKHEKSTVFEEEAEKQYVPKHARTEYSDEELVLKIWNEMQLLDGDFMDEDLAEIEMGEFFQNFVNDYHVKENNNVLVLKILDEMNRLNKEVNNSRGRREGLGAFVINLMKDNNILDVLGGENEHDQ